MRRRIFILGILAALCAAPMTRFAAAQPATASALELPLKPGSVRFAVIGDSGTGKRPQFEVAAQMVAWRAIFPFEFVLMLGDNIYGAQDAASLRKKFEEPYQPLLDKGVKFYATLGNHDDPNQRFYKPFNMGGQRYYTFKYGNAEFFALDSNYMNPEQLHWLDQKLSGSRADWKICFFHHPLYSQGKTHGPDLDLRARVEPLFEKYGVNVVFSGHEHFYERIKPQHGIYYFILGNAGQLRDHDIRPMPEMAKGFDTDRDFMMVEIAGDQLWFQVISSTGTTVDSGVLTRAKAASASAP